MTTPPFPDFERLAKLQLEIARSVSRIDRFDPPGTVGAVDVAYDGDTGYGALVVADASGRVLETARARVEVRVPYVAGLLAFREFPVIWECWRHARLKPDVLLLDGHGILHPRRAGLACHAGVVLDIPAIGIAKSLLCGEVQPRDEPDAAPVLLDGEPLGSALWPATARDPVYVSPGHRVSTSSAIRLVRGFCDARGPWPLRLADEASQKFKVESSPT